jgi:hypothetical protein
MTTLLDARPEEKRRLEYARLALDSARALATARLVPEASAPLVLALESLRSAIACLRGPGARALESSDSRASLEAILERDVEGDLAEEPRELASDLTQLAAEARRLLDRTEAPARQASRARWRARLPALGLTLGLGALVILVWWGLFGARNLSAAKPWRTSSSLATCHPERVECNGTRTRILFHTLSEPSPWFEFDLGRDFALSEIYLQNRSDYCPECAVPLVVEVSSDDREFRVAARRFSVFDRLTLPLATRARYVRVRVTRQSFLHLEDIRVFGRPI